MRTVFTVLWMGHVLAVTGSEEIQLRLATCLAKHQVSFGAKYGSISRSVYCSQVSYE